jgi:aspartyl/glutamyl-tRNA(Asn/Gln) amidotransferase C subunit
MFNRLLFVNLSTLKASSRFLNSKIPAHPVKVVVSEKNIKIDEATIESLERLSLVDFSNKEAICRLEEAIKFAQPLKNIKTDNVEPMYTVLDDFTLRLDEDVPVKTFRFEFFF